MAPSNLNLPLELLHLVADHLEPSARDISALSRTSRDLYNCITPRLYADEARASRAVLWAAATGHEAMMRKAVAFIRQSGGAAAVKALMQGLPLKGFGPLTLAARENHAHVAKFLLGTEGVDPMQAYCCRRKAPLAWAAEKGSFDVMRLLLADDRVDPNHCDIDGQNALFHAPITWDKEAAELLLNDGRVEPNSQDRYGGTVLSRVAEYGSIDVARIFLNDSRVDIDCRDGTGRTPLMHAVIYPYLKMVELLIERGADLNAVCNSGFSSLSFALWHSREAVLRVLLDQPGTDLNCRGRDGMTPLMHAVTARHVTGALRIFLATEGVDANAREYVYGDTALHRALKQGGDEVFCFLLACEKVDVNARDYNGQSPLIRAIAGRNIHSAKIILSKRNDADVNLRDYQGRTALMWATRFRNLEAVELLLAEKGIGRAPHDLSIRDHLGDTALSIAARLGWRAGVKALLPKCPVDVVNSQNNEGQAALAQAVENGHRWVVHDILAKDGVDVNTRDVYGRTPLLVAMTCRPLVSTTKYLLAKPGLDINAKDGMGRTALAIAVARSNPEVPVIKVLLGHKGIDLNPTDGNGKSWRRYDGFCANFKIGPGNRPDSISIGCAKWPEKNRQCPEKEKRRRNRYQETRSPNSNV